MAQTPSPHGMTHRCFVVALLGVFAPCFADADTGKPRLVSLESRLFRLQYHIDDASFCGAQACVDFDGDGQREIVFASRVTKKLHLLNAADGTEHWGLKLAGDQQSVAVFDTDGDGRFEILYSVSSPGRLYEIDPAGKVQRYFDSGDSKLGNSPVVLDADGDGKLEAFFGSRTRFLLRVNLQDFVLDRRRAGWVQCGCYTSAMDVDSDGKWDLFAGSGDDSRAKGVLVRYDPHTLQNVWSFQTDDNASSADAVLVDLDGDGRVEIVKSVDNYAGDEAHDAIYAIKTDGKMLWKAPGISGEDSPNVADLDGDGSVEIVGMTFGGEVYCLDASGKFRWRKDLRPELDEHAHAYMTPILCDLDGDAELEILAMTNGGYFSSAQNAKAANGVLVALSATGEVLDRIDLGGPRYWGHAFVCNVDDDPYLELVVSGSGGLDVVETRGFGPNTEHFQRRRGYQRLNVVPWAYEDSYFLHRGQRVGVVNRTDDLLLQKTPTGYRRTGVFTTELLTLPPNFAFDRLRFQQEVPAGTNLKVDLLDESGQRLLENVASGTALDVREAVRLRFTFSSPDGIATPSLDAYSLSFRPTTQ